MTQLAVIIPTLNERDPLESLLAQLARQRGIDLHIVVADAGSADRTADVARDAGATVVSCLRGRATQMNAGRATTTAPWLLFLHADTAIDDDELLANAVESLAAARNSSHCGHFRLRFRATGTRYRFLEAKTALNRPYTTNGDQGMLFAAEFFDKLGGFDERLPFLEDQRIADLVRLSGGRWCTLPGEISTSARRFEAEGFGRRYLAMALIMATWAGGADEFFELASGAYRPNPSERLAMTPLFRALHQTLWRLGPSRAARAWVDAATFARENLWQVFLAADIALGATDHHPILDGYDRLLARVDLRGLDLTIAAASFLLMAGVLPAWFAISERRH